MKLHFCSFFTFIFLLWMPAASASDVWIYNDGMNDYYLVSESLLADPDETYRVDVKQVKKGENVMLQRWIINDLWYRYGFGDKGEYIGGDTEDSPLALSVYDVTSSIWRIINKGFSVRA